ncbi:hypothetical protein AAZV13_08G322600 [Glycine max]
MEPGIENSVNSVNIEAIEVTGGNGHYTEQSGTSHEKIKGGWKTANILLANQALATLAFFGVGVNLVLFLTRVLHQESAEAANNVSKWTGTVYIFSLIGAFLSDSYWGRYLTCTIFQLIFVVVLYCIVFTLHLTITLCWHYEILNIYAQGLGMLSFTSWRFLIKPAGCGNEETTCLEPSSLGVGIFYLSIYLVAFGYGGHQPTLATFGADQFDEKNEKHRDARETFFCYFYFALNVGSLFSNTVLVYYENSGMWTRGFLVSLASAVIALVSYLAGYQKYKYVKAHGNPVIRVVQVFVATARKWKVGSAKEDQLYEVDGPESAIKGSRKILHSNDFRFMDKAATITEKDAVHLKNHWRLCTVTQVEEAKCVLRMLPVWLCTIIYSVVFTQMASLFVEQGNVMNNEIGKFHLPAASMSVLDICSVLLCTGIYRQILVPLAGRLSGNPRGLTELQRMGVGLVIGMLAMLAAGVTEFERLKHVTPREKASSLSIFWQIPQYVLVGASEVFMYVGQLEFFNGQAPDGIKSFGSSLCMASMSLGNYVSSMLVYMVMRITARGENPGWIPNNLNVGHMDRFFFLVAVLNALDFVLYLLCARWYKSINLGDGDMESQEDKEMIGKV